MDHAARQSYIDSVPGLQEQAFDGCEDCLTFNFPSAADGRGFSYARRARRERGEGFRIIATGNLLNGASANIVNTTVEFQPSPDFNGTAGFDYTIQDDGTTNGGNDFLTDVGQVRFTITPQNDPPVAVNDSGFNVDEGASVQIAGSALKANMKILRVFAECVWTDIFKR